MEYLQDKITDAQIANILTMWRTGCSQANISDCVGLSSTAVGRTIKPIAMVTVEGKTADEAMEYARIYKMEKVARKAFALCKIPFIEVVAAKEPDKPQQPKTEEPPISEIKRNDNTAMCMTRIIGELHQINAKLEKLIAELATEKE